MKFLLFSDLHHAPGVFMGGTEEDLELLARRGVEEQCEFVIHAGDFCHGAGKCPDYLERYHRFPIPTYHCLGNHDTDGTPLEETLRLYRMPHNYYFFDRSGCRMIVLDGNYLYLDGKHVNYSGGNYYKHPDNRDHLPPEELQWLEKAVEESPFPCILICHESFEREDGVQNRRDVRELIRRANRRKKNSVILCINGHNHVDHVRILEDVVYWEVNSLSYYWLAKGHNCFPEELTKEFSVIRHTAVYDFPLHAIVSWEKGVLSVEGSEGGFYLGITPEKTDNAPFDEAGREIYPRISSFQVNFNGKEARFL